MASKAAAANPGKAAAIKVYLATLDKAYIWTATHPTAWALALGKATGMSADVMTQAAKADANTPAQIPARPSPRSRAWSTSSTARSLVHDPDLRLVPAHRPTCSGRPTSIT